MVRRLPGRPRGRLSGPCIAWRKRVSEPARSVRGGQHPMSAAARRWVCSVQTVPEKDHGFFTMITGLIKAGSRHHRARRPTTSRCLPMYQRARLGIGLFARRRSFDFPRFSRWNRNIRAVLGGRRAQPEKKKREAELNSLLDEFQHHPDCVKTPSIALSGGERRRVEDSPRGASDPAAELHAARRTVRRHSIRSRSETSRIWSAISPIAAIGRADYRPQCEGNAGD